MVSTKRQVSRDRDRFGGYGEFDAQSVAPDYDVRVNAQAPEDIVSIHNNSMPGRTVVSDPDPLAVNNTGYAAPADNVAASPAFGYSTRETVKPEPELPKRPPKQEQPFNVLDIKPSPKTLQAAQERIEEDYDIDEEQSASVASRLTPKMKILLFVYLAIALVLAIAVIATGVTISSASASVDDYTARIAEKQQVIAAQEAEIALRTNEATIRDEAIELGMVYSDGSSAATVSVVDKVEYPQATPHTNGFDGFCKWLSGIIN